MTLEELSQPCVLWRGGKSGLAGYGRKYLGYGRCEMAHRWMWKQLRGPIPLGIEVCHHCDNPPCVNINHLFLGTHKENMDDRDRKQRVNHVRGERHPRARLTDDEVREIRQRHAAGETPTFLAAAFGCGKATVGDLVARRTRRDS